MSCCQDSGLRWASTSFRLPRSCPRASARFWGSWRKCSSIDSRRLWWSAGTQSLRRYLGAQGLGAWQLLPAGGGYGSPECTCMAACPPFTEGLEQIGQRFSAHLFYKEICIASNTSSSFSLSGCHSQEKWSFFSSPTFVLHHHANKANLYSDTAPIQEQRECTYLFLKYGKKVCSWEAGALLSFWS